MLSLICVGACFCDFVDIFRYTIMVIFSCLKKNLTAYKGKTEWGKRQKRGREEREGRREWERAKMEEASHTAYNKHMYAYMYLHVYFCVCIHTYIYVYIFCLPIYDKRATLVLVLLEGSFSSAKIPLEMREASVSLPTHIHPLRLPFIRGQQNTASFCWEKGREYDS